MPTSCDKTCRNNTIMDTTNITASDSFTNHIITPPSKLLLHDPAKGVDYDNDSDISFTDSYLVTNIMLGQEIIIGACVVDHFNNSATATQFVVNSNDSDYQIADISSVLVSCDKFQGVIIKGDKVCSPVNISVDIQSYIDGQSNSKKISVQLITELSPCHPGFHYNSASQHCICYDNPDIVSCSDDTSTIKRGYWFGPISGNSNCANRISTASLCPNNYCNFSCCETANGFYELSPVRMNQCNSHRSGTACGSCEEGYYLSFDSTECVSVNDCSAGYTVLVVTLSMVYWIVIVILVFIVTYYIDSYNNNNNNENKNNSNSNKNEKKKKNAVGIGYLYAITYYYSVLDILLSQNLYQSKGLFITVTTMSSLVKITPQFLGQLCFVKNMSGIDQQFIHYVHPLAVSIILVVICQAVKISRKFSLLVSRDIIRAICFLLLLSYTSVATTSLLLLRSLTFDNVDKVYTYLSPDIEYCHGRHLAYFIVAVLCTLVIVIGLPLLLLLEPFLSHKINFVRIKPLLDQFQGSYKAKYHCFAAYYMVCRLVVIVIIISIPPTDDLSHFLLIFSSGVLAAIVIKLKPYEQEILNIFDGLILQFLVLATLIPLVDNVSQHLSTATIIIVIILPLMFFIALELIVHKKTIKTVTKKIEYFNSKSNPATNNSSEVQMGDVRNIIDDNTRKNIVIM